MGFDDIEKTGIAGPLWRRLDGLWNSPSLWVMTLDAARDVANREAMHMRLFAAKWNVGRGVRMLISCKGVAG